MNKVISHQDKIRLAKYWRFNDRNAIKSFKLIGYLKGDKKHIRYTSKPTQQGVFI